MKEQIVSSNSNYRNNPCQLNKRRRDDMAASPLRFKGVVLQQNGNWGGPNRNFRCTDLTIQEPKFQDLHTTKEILGMVNDGSYQYKFTDSITTQSSNMINKTNGRVDEQVILCQQIFCKKLTQSDVGKLNRLVIPKKYALAYFPLVPNVSSKEGENRGKVEAIELAFFDRQLKPWRFRYCYWKSSRSFVLTKGWNRFVKENEAKANDTISFYMCEYKDDCKENAFCMMDVHPNDDESSGGFVGRIMESQSGLRGEIGYGSDGKAKRGEEGIRVCGSIVGKNDYMTDWKGKRGEEQENQQGIRLFGVQIK